LPDKRGSRRRCHAHSNLNVRRPFLELTLKVNGIRIGIAIGFNGLLIAVQRLDQRWLVAAGQWGSRR
jgi:hypothetical protein